MEEVCADSQRGSRSLLVRWRADRGDLQIQPLSFPVSFLPARRCPQQSRVGGQQLALTCVLRVSGSRQEILGGASKGIEMPEAVQGGVGGGEGETRESLSSPLI